MSSRANGPRGKREQIRRAAYRCFRDAGYHDASVDAICKRAQISKGSFYWHYTSKQEVFIDILETWTREVMDELYERFETALKADDYISAVTEQLVVETRRGRVIVPLWLEFTVLARREPEIQEALSKFYRRARTAIGEMLWPVIGDRVSASELRGMTSAILGAYAGLLMQEISDPERADARQAVRQVMSVLGWWVQLRKAASERGFQTERTMIELEDEAPLAPSGAQLSDEALWAFLGELPEPIQLRAREIHVELSGLIPEADQRVIVGWQVVGYDRGGLICGLKPRPRSLQLVLYRGASLDDPEGILKGKNKKSRYLDIPLEGDWPRGAVTAMLRESIDM